MQTGSRQAPRRRSSAGRIPIGPKKKIAFVCSGGATKAGAFHLGVALALQEQGFKFFGGETPPGESPRTPGPMEISTYVGSSAGSIISACLAAGYSLENIFNSFMGRDPDDPSQMLPRVLPRLTYQKLFKLRPQLAREQVSQLLLGRRIFTNLMSGNLIEAFLQFKWLRASGLFSTGGLEQYLREEVLPSNRFEDYPAELFIVATQLNHSRKMVFGKYNYQPPPSDLTVQYSKEVTISQAAAASTALPFIYAPYPIEKDGKTIHYIDGELRDTLSTHVAIDAGADLVFASYTHQPYHFTKERGSLTELGLPAILVQSAYLVIEQKINQHVHNKTLQRSAIEAVSRYCKQQGVSEDHRKRLCEILEAELHHRMDVDTIYIHPDPNDTDLFFSEHFTLSPAKLAEVVKSGFKAGVQALRRYSFADRNDAPVPVDVPDSSE